MKYHIIILCLFAFVFGIIIHGLLSIEDQKELGYYYAIEMHDTQIKVIDLYTGKTIYTEQYETNSNIVNALLEDNDLNR